MSTTVFCPGRNPFRLLPCHEIMSSAITSASHHRRGPARSENADVTVNLSEKCQDTSAARQTVRQNHKSALNKHKCRAHSHTKQPGEPAVNTQSYIAYMMLGMHRGTRHSAQKSMLRAREVSGEACVELTC